jgi:hypothetical protein
VRKRQLERHLRAHGAEVLREGAAVAAIASYLEDQRLLFGASQELSDVKLTDGAVISGVAGAGLNVPVYRDLRVRGFQDDGSA